MKPQTHLDNIQNAANMLRNFSNQVDQSYTDLYINVLNMMDTYIAQLDESLHDDPMDEMDMMCLSAENDQLKQQLNKLGQEHHDLQNLFVEVDEENIQLRDINIQLQLSQEQYKNYKLMRSILDERQE